MGDFLVLWLLYNNAHSTVGSHNILNVRSWRGWEHRNAKVFFWSFGYKNSGVLGVLWCSCVWVYYLSLCWLVRYTLYDLSVALYKQVLAVVPRMAGTKSSISSKLVLWHFTVPILRVLKVLWILFLRGIILNNFWNSFLNTFFFLNTFLNTFLNLVFRISEYFLSTTLPFRNVSSLSHLQDEVEQTGWNSLHVHKIQSLGFSESFQLEDVSLPVRADSSELCLEAYLTFCKVSWLWHAGN